MRDIEPGLMTGLTLLELLFTRCVSALQVFRWSVLQQSLIIHIKPPLCRTAEEGVGVFKSCFQGRRRKTFGMRISRHSQAGRHGRSGGNRGERKPRHRSPSWRRGSAREIAWASGAARAGTLSQGQRERMRFPHVA